MTANPMDLSGGRVLVTGASSGLGRAAAVLFSRLGARVVVVGRDEGRLRAALASLEGEGHAAAACDLDQTAALQAWLGGLAGAGGKFTALAHMAGVHSARPLRVLDAEHVDQVLHTNVTSAVALARAFRHKSCSERPASIVFAASAVGVVGAPGVSAYSASKGALVALTKSLAVELAGEQIRVNCLAPGIVETAMTDRIRAMMTAEAFAAIEAMHPLGLGRPEDVAAAAAFLISPAARWITGTTLVVDGGYTAQ